MVHLSIPALHDNLESARIGSVSESPDILSAGDDIELARAIMPPAKTRRLE